MIVERDLWLVKETKCRYHVNHISTKETVEIIRKAKELGLMKNDLVHIGGVNFFLK